MFGDIPVASTLLVLCLLVFSIVFVLGIITAVFERRGK